jgi:ligand-binding sensor domain-containing protein/signal transduction histidine kinase
LPDGQVTALAQTPDGYLWVGTPRGLARFDGVRFRVFTAESKAGLGDSRIASLATDQQGTLWVGTMDGNLTRRQGSGFAPAQPPAPLGRKADESTEVTEWSRNRRSALVADGEGGLWWHITARGTARLKDGRWTVFTGTNGLPDGVRELVCDRAGRVWAAAGNRLYSYASNRWDRAEQGVGLDPKSRLVPMAPAASGGVWVADRQSWGSLNPGRVRRWEGGQAVQSARFSDKRSIPSSMAVSALLEDRTGRLWVGTEFEGMGYLDGAQPWCCLEGIARKPGYVSCLFEDRQGSVWVGTLDDGLYGVTPQPVMMLSLPGSSQPVFCLCAMGDDTVWAGTDDAGVFRYQDGQWEPVDGDWGSAAPRITSLCGDSLTNVWAGTKAGLYRLEEGRFRRVQGSSELNGEVQVVFKDRSGGLWFGTRQSLVRLHEGEFTVYPLKGDIFALTEDASGELWIGTDKNGLFRLPPGQTRALHRVEGFPAKSFRSLFCDQEGTLWVSVYRSGLFRQRDDAFEALTVADGLPTDNIASFVNDRAGNLWMGSANGIIGLSPEALRGYARGESPPMLCQHLSLREGLNHRNCYAKGYPLAARTSDGRLWFVNGPEVAVFDPARVLSNQTAPRVLVESVLADGKELPLAGGAALRGSTSIRRFEFSFTALDLAAPESLRFRYRLQGLDTDWVEAGRERTAQYSQLPAGNYEFHVMAGGPDGKWHEAGREVRLEVVPRLWERRWVQLLATGLLVGLTGGSVAWRHRRRMQLRIERLEMEQKVESERRRIARDMHDELGSRLTQIAYLGELATKESQPPQEMRSQLDAMTGRVREVMNAMGEVVWTVNPKNDSLPKVAAWLSDYVESFVAPTGISHRLDVAPDLPDLRVAGEARHQLLLAIKEALNNAVRHAAPRSITLKIHVQDRELEVTVADDGQGFEVEQAKARGRGLSHLPERMAIVKGRAEIRSEPGQGTRVMLWLPLGGRRRDGCHTSFDG